MKLLVFIVLAATLALAQESAASAVKENRALGQAAQEFGRQRQDTDFRLVRP